MKIVSVMTTASQGGAEFAAAEMLDALADRGHQAVIVTDLPQIARSAKVGVSPIAIGPKLSTATWPGLLASFPLNAARLYRALEREWPYEVLLVHYKKEQLLARLLPRRLRATLVWAEWGPVPSPLRRGLPRLAYLDAAKRARKIMAVSAGTKASVCAVGVSADKVEVVPNVVRTEEISFTARGRARVREELGISPDAFVVGCISRFHPKKRNDVVVDAVKRLDPRVHLVMAGDGETEEHLRALAAPLDSRAHFVPTPGDEIADVLSAFDVSVFCPSPTEGAPRAVILAMLAERPCLATGAAGVSDMITQDIGAITSPENDPEALAHSVRPYLDDRDRVRRHGVEARRRAVEVYDAPVIAQGIEQLLEAAGAR